MDDLISRQAVIDCYKKWQPYMSTKLLNFEKELYCIPSVTPSYNSIKTALKPSEDCISRQDAIDATCAECSAYNCRYRDENVKHASCDYVDRLKRIQSVQPKMGQWIMPQMDDGMSDPVVYQVRCSVCKWDVDPQIWYEDLAHGFCPNCGAKMGGDDNADSD